MPLILIILSERILKIYLWPLVLVVFGSCKYLSKYLYEWFGRGTLVLGLIESPYEADVCHIWLFCKSHMLLSWLPLFSEAGKKELALYLDFILDGVSMRPHVFRNYNIILFALWVHVRDLFLCISSFVITKVLWVNILNFTHYEFGCENPVHDFGV